MKEIKLDIQKFAGPTNIVFPNNGNMEGYIRWESSVVGSTTQEKAQLNKSSVTAYLYVRRNDGYSTWGDFSGGITINGQSQNFYPVWISVSGDWVYVAQKTVEVPHNADGSKSITISGWVTGPTETTWEGKTVSGSGTATLDKIPRYATSNQSVNSKTETSITMNWSSDNTCDYVWYSTNNGSSWTAVGSVNGTSGSYTISGLTPETQYNIKTRVRRKDSQLTTDSSATGVTTYNYPTLGGGSNFVIGGEGPLIQMNNPMSRPLTVTILTETGTPVKTINNVTSSFRPTFTNEEKDLFYASIPNKKSGTYKVKTESSVNTNTKDARQYSIDENASKPTFTTFDYEDIDATTLALTGDSSIIVKGYSDLRVTITTQNKAMPNNSATMKKYNLMVGSGSNFVNYSLDQTVTVGLNNISSNLIRVNAEDSRGLTTEVQQTLAIPNKYKEYTDIQKDQINITRQSNVGQAVTLEFNGTYWNNSFGSVTNTITSNDISYRFKKTNEENWTTGTTTIIPTLDGNTYSFSGGIVGDIAGTGFDTQYSYNVEITVQDKLSTTTFTFVLGTGVPHIAVADDGIAIKQPYDTNESAVLQVNGTVKASNIDFRNTWDANIEWKENGYGDKFRIIPAFSGTDDDNKLKIQGTVGGAGTDPTTWTDLMTISGKSGNVGVAKSIQIPKNSGAGYGLTNSDGTSIIRDWNNSCVTVDATGGGLYLGIANTTSLNLLNGKGSLDSSGNLTISGKYKSTGISIADGGNSWKKVDIGFCRVYFKTFTFQYSYAGNGWGWVSNSNNNLPSGITFNQNKMAFFGDAVCDDTAISHNVGIGNGSTAPNLNWRNKYGGAVNGVYTKCNYTLIDFS